MKIIKNPARSEWKHLAKRPEKYKDDIETSIQDIISKVKQNGDSALKKYTQKFDSISVKELSVTPEELRSAKNNIDEELQAAIQLAKRNIEIFHRSQLKDESAIETMEGVKCWRRSVPIEKVGLYVPGGSAPLLSTVLMLGIPAKLAGCKEIILCTPPQKNGQIHPAILYTANLVGIETIYKVGGAQAIAAMAYGTTAIPKMYKIFGPGNTFVTKAKEFVQQAGVAIDMPAGPSEQLVIADETSNPAFVAADLLSQAEHGADSQVVLLSNDQEFVKKAIAELKDQLNRLPRKEIAEKALENSFAAIFNSLAECMNFSNCYAPEHLIIAADNSKKWANIVTNAGSVFIGNYSCESAGDYASGTNHTLPTDGCAKSYSGVSMDSFMKKITFQKLSAEGIKNIGPSVERMAEAEGLSGHRNAVSLRLSGLHPPTYAEASAGKPESPSNPTSLTKTELRGAGSSRDSYPLRRGPFANVEKLVRPHIKALTPYSSARDEFTGNEGVFLDANENPFGDYNRYPDPHQDELKKIIGGLKNVDLQNIFLGNGSDEIIDLMIRIFCKPGADKVITFEPTFGMYQTSAEINSVRSLKFSLNEDFQIDVDEIKFMLKDSNLKLIFICSPNNPTGNVINPETIRFILNNFKGMVIIDEAYIDFSSSTSWLTSIGDYPNLVVLQTLSKARAMAGLRIGMAFANPTVIQYLNKMKPPYNISRVNQDLALEKLQDQETFQSRVETILNERERVTEALENCGTVKKIYPSDTNFILVEVDNADLRYKQLIQQDIVVRNRNKQLNNCLRITIGKTEENDLLINIFKSLTK